MLENIRILTKMFLNIEKENQWMLANPTQIFYCGAVAHFNLCCS